MQYRVLGGLEVVADDAVLDLGGPKQRLVLALLLLAGGRPVGADRLVELVWGDDPPERVSTSLQTYVSNLRRLLEPGRQPRRPPTVLVTRPGGYALELQRGQLDLHRFEDLVHEGDALQRRGEHAPAVERLAAARRLWAPLLPEFADEPSVVDAARRAEALHLVALERDFDARLALGEASSLLAELGDAVTEAPLHERFRAQLATALYRSGRQTEALRALSEARRTLAEEVGVEPGPALRQLEADILGQSPTLGPSPAPAAPVAAPPSTVRPMFGRERELAVGLEALERALAGAGTAVVLSGEPGIGKTRIAEELATCARAGGVAVAWARCTERTAPAFEPLATVSDELADRGVVQLPDLRAVGGAGEGDPIELRHRFVRQLRSAVGPAVVVVDDLQWADPASLRLIELLAGDLHAMQLLLVVTTRPVGHGAGEALVDCLGELARAPGAVRVPLEGLELESVEGWIEERLGPGTAPSVARLVHQRSGGNPFFASELVALLDAGTAADATALAALRVPDAVADVVRRRIGRLPTRTQQLLSAASVLGTAFDLDVAAGVVDEPLDELLDALDPALGAGLVVEEERSLVGYRFSHALVAEALVAELAPSRRARLHARAVSALESARSGRLDAHAAELAHHALAGARAGTAGTAVSWSIRAGELAEAALAPEDAAGHYQRALGAAEVAAPRDLRLRYRLLRSLARACAGAGAEERSQAALADAIEVAAQLDDLDAMTSAARALAHPTLWMPGDYLGGEVRLARLVDLVVDRLGPDADPVDAAALLGFATTLRYYSSPPAEAEARSRTAVELARASGSLEVLATVSLQRVQSTWVPGSAAIRLEAATEAVAAARAAGLVEAEAVGRLARLVAAHELGEVDDAEAAALTRLALARGTVLAQLETITFQVARLGSRGRYGEALELAGTAEELFRRTGRRAAAPTLIGSTALSLIDTAQVDQLAVVPEPGYAVATGEVLAFALVESGSLDDARAVVGEPGSVPTPPADWLWLSTTYLATLVRVALGDAAAVAELRARLEPHAGLVAMAGSLPLGGTDLALGRAAALLGEREAALAHLDRVVALEERMGSHAWLARALEARAEIGGRPGDRERARVLAEQIGCRPVLRRLGDG